MKGDSTILALTDFDYDSTQSKAVLPVQGFNKATIQIPSLPVAIGSCVITYRKSLNGTDWTDIGTLSALGVSSTIDVTGFALLGAFVTTALGSACVAPLILYAEYI